MNSHPPVLDHLPAAGRRRKNDPEGMRKRILEAAQHEFAQTGLSGARLDAIAERAHTNKRMVVYYFRSKEELYIAVLERVYGEVRDAEQQLQLAELPPEQAVARLVEFTFDYHSHHPEFIRLVSIENIHHAAHIAKSSIIQMRNRTVIDSIEDVLARGCNAGIFRAGIDAIDLHMMISSLCFFRVSNRHTFATIFGRDLSTDECQQRHRRMVVEAVLSYLKA